MPKRTFSEPEVYLLQNWTQARDIEVSMERIREKYNEVLEGVWETVRSTHDELDWCEIRPTQFWCRGYMGIGKREWVTKKRAKPGIYAEHLRLELFADKDAEGPYMGVWCGNPKNAATDAAGAKRIISKAKQVMSEDEIKRWQFGEPSDLGYVVRQDLVESGEELLKMLAEGTGQRFVDCLASYFSAFSKLVPAMDEAFSR